MQVPDNMQEGVPFWEVIDESDKEDPRFCIVLSCAFDEVVAKDLQPETKTSKSAEELWCVCREPSFGDMIGCDNLE